MINDNCSAWHEACKNPGVLLPSHTLVFRDHTRVFLTLFVALVALVTFFAPALLLAS